MSVLALVVQARGLGSFIAGLSRSQHSEMWLFQVSRLFPAAVPAFAPLRHELRPPPGRLYGTTLLCLYVFKFGDRLLLLK